MKVFVVSMVDVGVDGDCIPSCLGIFNSKEYAEEFIIKNAEEKKINIPKSHFSKCDDFTFNLRMDDNRLGITWNINELDFK